MTLILALFAASLRSAPFSVVSEMILNNGRCSPTFLEVLVFAVSAVLILDDTCRVRHLLDHHVLGK